MRTLDGLTKLLAVGALLAAGGCVDYKYIDIHASFDGTFDITTTQQLNFCFVTVSGADSGKFRLPPGRCPNRIMDSTGVVQNPLDAGTFQFSTFAESGTITFKLDGYTSTGINPMCITASGEKAVTITGESTIKDSLVISKVAGGMICNSMSP